MADIKKELNDIKNAVYGREVRSSIHDGIKKINDEAENAIDLSESAKHQVENIQQQVNQLVVEGDSSVEAAQARVDEKGKTHATLKARIDYGFEKTNQQLAQISVNIKDYFQEGDVDYTNAFKRAIDALQALGGGTMLVPSGDYLVRADQNMAITSNITIRGQGNSRFYTEETSGYDRIFTVVPGAKNVVIDNIIIDQWGDDFNVNTSNPLGFLLVATDFKNLTIKNCEFRFWSADALMVTSFASGCEPLYVKDNRFIFKRMGSALYDCTGAYLSNGAYQEVSGNMFESIDNGAATHWMLASAIEIHSPYANVHHNTFKDVQNCVLVVPNGDNVTYTGDETPSISINNNTARGVSVFSEMYPTRTRTLDIKNVHITDNNCILYGRSQYPVNSFVKTYFDPSSPTPSLDERIHIEDVYVDNNVIKFEYTGDYDLNGAIDRVQAGVFMVNGNCRTRKVYIRDNIITNYPYMVLNTFKRGDLDSVGVEFINNTIVDCGYANNTGGANAIFSLTNVNGLRIEKNTIKYIDQKTRRLMYVGPNVTLLNYENNKIISFIDGFDCQTVYYTNRDDIVNCGKIDIDYLRRVSTNLGEPKVYYSYDGTIPERTYHVNDVILYVSNDVKDKKGVRVTSHYNAKNYSKQITRKGSYDNVIVDDPEGLEIGDLVRFNVGGIITTYITRIDGNEIGLDFSNPLPEWEGTVTMTAQKIGELEPLEIVV